MFISFIEKEEEKKNLQKRTKEINKELSGLDSKSTELHKKIQVKIILNEKGLSLEFRYTTRFLVLM